MRDTEVRVANFSRDRLPDLFQGALRSREHVRLGDLVSNIGTDELLVAVWAPTNERLNPLPNLIVGSREALNDLCAWSKAYMSGVGPLSGLMRLVTFDQLPDLEWMPEIDDAIDIESAGQQVAVILAEVAARSTDSLSRDRVSLKSCLNTLAYSMFRSLNRGLPIDGADLAMRWSAMRSNTQHHNNDRINNAVLSACYATGSRYVKSVDNFDSWNRYADGKQFPLLAGDDARRDELTEAISGVLNDPNLSRRPREDLVRLVDVLLRSVDRGGVVNPLNNFMLAKLIVETTRGLSNQFALMGDASKSNPEVILYLSLLQDSVPAPEILSSFNGVGWKLLSRLAEPFDVFKRPDCDISFEEANLYNIDHRGGLGGNGKVRVEIAWGATIEISTEKSQSHAQLAARERYDREQKRQIQRNQQAIEFLEGRLVEALELTRRMKEDDRRRR